MRFWCRHVDDDVDTLRTIDKERTSIHGTIPPLLESIVKGGSLVCGRGADYDNNLGKVWAFPFLEDECSNYSAGYAIPLYIGYGWFLRTRVLVQMPHPRRAKGRSNKGWQIYDYSAVVVGMCADVHHAEGVTHCYIMNNFFSSMELAKLGPTIRDDTRRACKESGYDAVDQTNHRILRAYPKVRSRQKETKGRSPTNSRKEKTKRTTAVIRQVGKSQKAGKASTAGKSQKARKGAKMDVRPIGWRDLSADEKWYMREFFNGNLRRRKEEAEANDCGDQASDSS